jgi:serine/threonine protein kinase/lipoprotein NlpI
VRNRSLRDLLRESSAAMSPELEAERREWLRVRDAVADLCALPRDEREHRLPPLRASADPVDRRIAAMVDLEQYASGFLESPPVPPPPSVVLAPIYQPGDAIGRYRVISLLGAGGMGQVYLADDTELFRQVAVKVLTDPADASLLREARIAASLKHDLIVDVYDVLEANGRLHIVMERLTGRSLAELVHKGGLDARDAGHYVALVLHALEYAHAQRVIHCDVKPANVFVLPSHTIKVLDFGLARLDPRAGQSASLALAGTPRYLAPERLLGEPPGARTDIYSVGVVLSDLLTGDAISAKTQSVTRARASKSLRRALLRIASKATAPDPADRYASAADMRLAVDAALGGQHGLGDLLSWRFVATAAALAAVLAAALWNVALPRPSAERPVMAVDMAAIGDDPLARHIAAAYEALVERSLSGATNLVLVRQGSASPTAAHEVGATHVLEGIVERAGDAIKASLTMKTADDAILASHTVHASIADPQALAGAIMAATDQVLRRSGLTVTRNTIDAEVIRQSLSLSPQAFEDYAQAREYLRTPEVPANADLAIQLLTRALAKDPSFVLAHASLAEAYWQKYLTTRDTSWTDRARTAALEALRLQPDDPAVRYTLAVIYRGMGRRAEALSELSNAIALEPTNDDMYRLRGRVHSELGDLDQALDDLATARSLRPGYWDNHRVAGLVLYEAGRFDDAATHFQRVTELRPNNASAYQTLGTAWQAGGRIPEALGAYNKALSIAPNANTYSNIAKIHYDSGRYDEARKAYEESVRIQPKIAATRRNLGDTLARIGEVARSRASYETAIQLANADLQVDPSDHVALSLQAICYAKLGRRAEALQLANKVLANPKVPATSRYRYGVALVLANERDHGIEQVVRAIQDGFSKNEVKLDPDLEAVRSDARLQAALKP